MCDTYMRVNENVRQVRQQWRLACFPLFAPFSCFAFNCASASVKQDLHEHQVNNIKTISVFSFFFLFMDSRFEGKVI